MGDGLTLGSIEAIQDAVTRHADTTITEDARRRRAIVVVAASGHPVDNALCGAETSCRWRDHQASGWIETPRAISVKKEVSQWQKCFGAET